MALAAETLHSSTGSRAVRMRRHDPDSVFRFNEDFRPGRAERGGVIMTKRMFHLHFRPAVVKPPRYLFIKTAAATRVRIRL